MCTFSVQISWTNIYSQFQTELKVRKVMTQPAQKNPLGNKVPVRLLWLLSSPSLSSVPLQISECLYPKLISSLLAFTFIKLELLSFSRWESRRWTQKAPYCIWHSQQIASSSTFVSCTTQANIQSLRASTTEIHRTSIIRRINFYKFKRKLLESWTMKKNLQLALCGIDPKYCNWQ